MTTPLLEMRQITKEFPGVTALKNVSFQVFEGEIHCLVGENGAGKSTLMKILSGVYPYGDYRGQILIRGEEQRFRGIRDSERAGIAIIYQELALVPELSIYENIFLGNEIRKGARIDWNETINQAKAMLSSVRLNINPETKVRELSVGQQQLVEIAKALSRNVKLLILDEPTAALNEDDSANLLHLLRGLRNQGVTCILISHKLKEVLAIADRITVLRDGQTICTLDARTTTINEQVLIKHMVGREIQNIYPRRRQRPPGDVVLATRHWSAYDPASGRSILHDINLHVRRGEIVGIAGLMGSGRTELALSLFGNAARYHLQGELWFAGQRRVFRQPRDAIRAGLAYVSEDRKAKGLILIQDVRRNMTLANLRAVAHGGVIDRNAEVRVAYDYRHALNIKTPSIEQPVGLLSGGNQQKVCLAKWLFVKPQVLILDEPTRGIDVGAKYEIYQLMNQLVDQGMSIIMISSELPEILGMSDRIYVVAGGRISGELPIAAATQEAIMQLATT
ncbi:ATP-binding cassette domain-containing protein [Kallotenue papyrolyticum]|uniref:ATP-binding cassette domain-containing protein n=1 Tax=Kallotenue papyrolyticum TaxID=1325125 RepID=UPI000492BC6C|nr:ATP-binding cassette domain-containing protein [Kallotenue papyrolyticum]